jgi:hypothetical protein
MRFQQLPLGKRLLVLAIGIFIAGATIAYVAFIQVTLTKTFEFADPWDTVKAFLVVTGALLVVGFLLRLHETR